MHNDNASDATSASGPSPIRPMRADDLTAAQGLMRVMDYEIDVDELAVRFAAIIGRDDHLLLVAEDPDGQTVGLLHAYVRAALEKPVEVIVQALAVFPNMHGTGIGGRLLNAAEQWAEGRGLASVALYSQVTRTASHQFYLRRGYSEANRSLLMRKYLT